MTISVFISHVANESEVAVWIKSKIGALFQGKVEFFVSSDGSDIVGGDRWLDKIEAALKKSETVLVLCSDKSVCQPWVNFEAGGAWMAGKRVVPLCHGGMEPGKLPQPLATLQAYSLSNPEDLHRLITLLAKTAGLEPPQYDVSNLVQVLPHYPENSASVESRQASKTIVTSHRGRHTPSSPGQQVDRSDYEFDKRTGIHRHKATKEAVCTNCLLEERVSPLAESPEGWRCQFNNCGKFYSNPDFVRPRTARNDRDPRYR